MLTSSETIFGIDTEDSVSSYNVGVAIHYFAKDAMAILSEGDPERLKRIQNRHNIIFWWYSSIAYVCKSDGIFGAKEKKFVFNRAKQAGFSDDFIKNKVFLGVDYIDNLINEVPIFWKEFDPSLTNKERERRTEMFFEIFLLYCLLAATQDGLISEEYQTVENIAKRLPLQNPTKMIQECVKLIKLERQLAITVQETMIRKSKL